MYFIGGIVLVGIGLLMIFHPRFFFELTEGWKHSGSGEPSRLYLFSTRFGGVMMALAGAMGVVAQFW